MRPLRGLIICEDPELCGRIEELLREGNQVDPTLILHRYPERTEASRHLRLCRPEIALLAIDRLQSVLDFVSEAEVSMPGIPMIGISHLQDPRALTELMRLGIRDCIATPLNRAKFQESITRITYSHRQPSTPQSAEPMVCFLPSRGGSGASTLACNVSHAMSTLPNAQVLLADLDQTAGLSRFLFNLSPACSLYELSEDGRSLDERTWRQALVTFGQLEIVHAGPLNPRHPFTGQLMRKLLAFMRAPYTAICVDLTSGLETYALELIQRSRRILLVSTTERASLELAREKIAFLSEMDLHSRVSVLLTLLPKAGAPDIGTVAAYLNAPVAGVFDFEGKRVRRCLEEGLLMDAKTTLGRQVHHFAQNLSTQLIH